MAMSTRPFALAAGLLGLGTFATGLLTDGGSFIPKPERAALRGARAAVHEELERRESSLPAGPRRDDGRWRAHVDVVLEEVERGHIDAAVRAWYDAYGAAIASHGWEGMIAVGDAFMAIGHATHATRGARMNARGAYMTALVRARRDRSVDGALRSAEAFRQLGDRAVAEQCLHIAAQLAAGDEQAQRRVREVWRVWTAPPAVTEF